MKVWANISPVCFLGGNKLVMYRHGSFSIYNMQDFTLWRKYSVFVSLSEGILNRMKIVSRFLRLGVRCAIPLSESSFAFFLKDKIYEFDVISGCLSSGYGLEAGVRPLQFTSIEGIRGFRNGIYWGAYLSNPQRKEVPIYYRESPSLWKKVFIFKAGLINHIHALIPDKYNQCVWIFTGDFDEAAGIWKATDGFSVVEPVLLGKQEYRGCVAFPTPMGLLYATDSQFIYNSVRILQKNDEEYVSKFLSPLNGSCIYGCKIGNKYIFETSVEGTGIYKNLIHFLFSQKTGPGIKSRKVCLYVGNLDAGFKEIYSQEKDCLPFSFQFGTFQFPSGDNITNYIVFRQVAVKKNDLSTIIMNLEQ